MKPIPTHWVNGEAFTMCERLQVAMLRIAGCECELPLLGCHKIEHPWDMWLPRCRLCNTETSLPPSPEEEEQNQEEQARADQRSAEEL